MDILYVDSNAIEDGGVHSLVENLPFCTTLETLVLHNNGIHDEGAMELAAVIDSCMPM